MTYGLSTKVAMGFTDALAATRKQLAAEGFGVLTEIDMAAALKTKLDAEITPHVILGACRPQLAYAAVQAEPSIGLLLPCNVVVRAADAQTTIVEVIDPSVMVDLTENPAMQIVADEARERLGRALEALTKAAQ